MSRGPPDVRLGPAPFHATAEAAAPSNSHLAAAHSNRLRAPVAQVALVPRTSPPQQTGPCLAPFGQNRRHWIDPGIPPLRPEGTQQAPLAPRGGVPGQTPASSRAVPAQPPHPARHRCARPGVPTAGTHCNSQHRSADGGGRPSDRTRRRGRHGRQASGRSRSSVATIRARRARERWRTGVQDAAAASRETRPMNAGRLSVRSPGPDVFAAASLRATIWQCAQRQATARGPPAERARGTRTGRSASRCRLPTHRGRQSAAVSSWRRASHRRLGRQMGSRRQVKPWGGVEQFAIPSAPIPRPSRSKHGVFTGGIDDGAARKARVSTHPTAIRSR
jgi:hypothetical protein